MALNPPTVLPGSEGRLAELPGFCSPSSEDLNNPNKTVSLPPSPLARSNVAEADGNNIGESILKTKRLCFVPLFLLSNCMSIVPKIDEVSFFIKQHYIEIAMFSETWLRDSIPDGPIEIRDYRLFRRDRKIRAHGGVCIYVKESIESKMLLEFHNDEHEVFWLLLRPRRLPRGFSNIIVACLYHPPDADNTTMSEYLKSTLEMVETQFSNSAIILAGDFNKLSFKIAARCYELKPTINFPTRGSNTLDQIYTNMQNYYQPPTKNPPFGLSDHITITVFPKVRERSKLQWKTIRISPKKRSTIASLGQFFMNIPWTNLLFKAQSSDEKLNIFTEIIRYGLDTIMPERSIKVHRRNG